MFLVGADEGGIILKSALGGGLDHRYVLADQGARHEKPLVDDIVMDGVSGLFFKLAHHMVFAEEKTIRETVDRQVFVQVPVDMPQKFFHLGIGRVGLPVVDILFFQKNAVNVYHKLGKEGVFEKTVPETALCQRILQFKKKILEMFLQAGVQTDKTETPVCGFLEAGVQKRFADILPYPEDKTFVGKRKIDLRFVDRPAADQQDIPRVQVVGFPFDMIADFPGKKYDHFVKIMIVVFVFFRRLVFDVKQAEIFFQIA